MAKSKQQQHKEVMDMILKIVRGWVGLETSNTRLNPKQEEHEVRNLIRQYDQLTKELDAENSNPISKKGNSISMDRLLEIGRQSDVDEGRIVDDFEAQQFEQEWGNE